MGNLNRSVPSKAGGTRFYRIFACDSIATELLQGCPVVTAEGRRIGTVDALLIDRKTRQLRYVILEEKTNRAPRTAAIAIPWQALYFDSAMARLVFYTYS
ncbi:MAG TPA: PRC-barrel domain-containing protein [Paucimonas sp.]|nr:PRC-barrel domain-containing protein [Paucimonas sp.]